MAVRVILSSRVSQPMPRWTVFSSSGSSRTNFATVVAPLLSKYCQMLPAATPMFSEMSVSIFAATGFAGDFAAAFASLGFGVDALASVAGFLGSAWLVLVATGGSAFTGLVEGTSGLVVFVVIYKTH